MQLFGLLTVRKRPLLVGVTAAWYLAVSLLALAPALIASPASAQKPVTCFLRAECIDPKTVGNCDTEHCFEARPKDCPNAQGACYANPPAVPLIIAIGGKTRALDISDYIAIIFNYGVGIAGLIATVMFMIGGFQYLSAGTSDRVNQGKERIKNAIIGMILAFGAIILLRTVNPDILKLQMPKIEITKRKTLATCMFTESCFPCGMPYVVLSEKGTGKTATSTGQCEFARAGTTLSEADAAKYDSSSQCIGQGCGSGDIPASGGESACSDLLFNCQRAQQGEKFACGHAPAAPKDAPPSDPGTSGGYVCKACKPDGASCVRGGKNDECCNKFCSTGITGNKCASGQPGDACNDDSECMDGKCQQNWSNSCSTGAVGSPCDDNKQCKTGTFCSTYGKNTCSKGELANYCDGDDECGDGLRCATPSGYPHFCAPKAMIDDQLPEKFCKTGYSKGFFGLDCCSKNADCAGHGDYCYNSSYSANFCTTGALGVPCGDGTQCASGKCVELVCVDGSDGSRCANNNDCTSKRCAKLGDYNVCVSGGKNSRCDSNSGCQKDLACKDNRCVNPNDAPPPSSPSAPATPGARDPLNPYYVPN